MIFLHIILSAFCPQGLLVPRISSPIQVPGGLLVLKDGPLEMVNNCTPKIVVPGNSVEQQARNCHQESNSPTSKNY